MTTRQDLSFREGQNWRIVFTAHDDAGAVIPLDSGAQVNFRINTVIDGVTQTALTLAVGNGITISDAPAGLADIVVETADQTVNNITAEGVHFYEIEIVVAELTSPQAEGRLKVLPSLFATEVDPLLEEFNARFTEFTEDDATKLIMIHDAKRVVEGNSVWDADEIPVATVYLAAHLLMMRKIATRQYEEGGVQVGALRVISVEDRSLGFNNPSTSQQGSQTGLAATAYGKEYLSMLRRHPVFILRA